MFYDSRRSTVLARNGMVATSQPLAALAGLRQMMQGGNAVDAAVALHRLAVVVNRLSVFELRFLEAAVGDERPRNMATDHPLRIIEDYAHSLSGTMSNRRNVLTAALTWIDKGGNADVAVEAVATVIDPQIRGSWSDPGAGNTWTISQKFVSLDDIAELEQFWEEVLALAARVEFTRFGSILAAWENWVWPSRSVFGSAAVPHDVYKRAKQVARKVAINIRDTFGDRPGIMARLKRTCLQSGLRVRVDLPSDFEVLFPIRDQPKGEFAVEKHHEMERRQHAKARRLGKRLSDESPGAVVERLMGFEHEADIGSETEPDGEADKAGDQVVNAKVGRPEAQAKPGATFWAHGALERADVIPAYRARQ
ncbi:MAG: hypothetical protein IIC97_03885 [Chloroflexi bacterium]|nr:hypothetical protein [Chloroflexota bacterium]